VATFQVIHLCHGQLVLVGVGACDVDHYPAW
jgi:hypothetical protein